MKRHLHLLSMVILCAAVAPAWAQFGGPGQGPLSGGPPGARFNAALTKLFGEHTGFSGVLDLEVQQAGKDSPMTIPGKVAFLEGKNRFEIDMTQMKGAGFPAEMATQLKAMGMAEMLMIARPDKKLVYMSYPGMQAYMEQPMPAEEAARADAKFKIDVTELGKETVGGHPCVKNKVVVTDEQGKPFEATVWNATDLKKFPVKMEYKEKASTLRLNFKDIKLEKPEAKLFDPPAGFTRYDSMQAMMQAVMMKRMGVEPPK